METILRLIWLPLILLLCVQFVWAYCMLDLLVEEPIQAKTVLFYTIAQEQYKTYPVVAWQRVPWHMFALTIGVVISSLYIIASFMVPLIRYAATGEKPPEGLFRQSWGIANLRFSRAALLSGFVSLLVLFAPLMAAMNALNQHILRSVVKIEIPDHVKFPFEESLHTVYQSSIADLVTNKANVWVLGIPVSILALAIPILSIFLFLMVRHFAFGRMRGGHAGEGTSNRKTLFNVLIVLLLSMVVFFLLWGMVSTILPRPPIVDSLLPKLGGSLGHFSFFAVSLFLLLAYLNMRLFAWPGYAVMRRPGPIGQSKPVRNNIKGFFFLIGIFAIGALLYFFGDKISGMPGMSVLGQGWNWVFAHYISVMSDHGIYVLCALIVAAFVTMYFSNGLRANLITSRGTNLFRIIGLFLLVFIVTYAMQYAINFLLNKVVFRAVSLTYAMLVTSTRLSNSGVSAAWITPTILWSWTGFKVLVNLFWMIFSYGVLAGLYGRLFTHTEARRPLLP